MEKIAPSPAQGADLPLAGNGGWNALPAAMGSTPDDTLATELRASAKVRRTTEGVSQTVAHAWHQLCEKGLRLRVTSRGNAEWARDYLRHKPSRAVGLAAAVGSAFSRLFKQP